MYLIIVSNFVFFYLTYKFSNYFLNKDDVVNKITKKSVIDCFDNAF